MNATEALAALRQGMADSIAERFTMRQTIAELLAALEPFAETGKSYLGDPKSPDFYKDIPDSNASSVLFNVGDLRAAARAYARAKGTP